MKILWASVHNPTKEQIDSLKVFWGMENEILILSDVNNQLSANLSNIKADSDLGSLASQLIRFARANHCSVVVQPAGSPAFQYRLGMENATWNGDQGGEGVCIIYSHSDRVSQEEVLSDGTVNKVSVFKHVAWV